MNRSPLTAWRALPPRRRAIVALALAALDALGLAVPGLHTLATDLDAALGWSEDIERLLHPLADVVLHGIDLNLPPKQAAEDALWLVESDPRRAETFDAAAHDVRRQTLALYPVAVMLHAEVRVRLRLLVGRGEVAEAFVQAPLFRDATTLPADTLAAWQTAYQFLRDDPHAAAAAGRQAVALAPELADRVLPLFWLATRSRSAVGPPGFGLHAPRGLPECIFAGEIAADPRGRVHLTEHAGRTCWFRWEPDEGDESRVGQLEALAPTWPPFLARPLGFPEFRLPEASGVGMLTDPWGERLSFHLCRRELVGERLTLAEAVRLLCRVGEALDWLHRRDPPVVHGNLTADAVLVGERGRVVLAHPALFRRPGQGGAADVAAFADLIRQVGRGVSGWTEVPPAGSVRELCERLLASLHSPTDAPAPEPVPVVPPARRDAFAAAEAAARRERPHPGGLLVAPDGPADFRSLAAAVKAATPGSRIYVRPGVYRESITLDRAVEILGDGPAHEVVVVNDGLACIIASASASIRGLTLRLEGPREGYKQFAVEVRTGSRLVLEDCAITSRSLSAVGIHGQGASAELHRCRLHESAECGLYAYKHGVARLEDCDITGNEKAGVSVSEQARVTLRGCRVSAGRSTGVSAYQTGRVELHDCDVTGNTGTGVHVWEHGEANLHTSRVRDNQGAGLWVGPGSGFAADCEFAGNTNPNVSLNKGTTFKLLRCRVHGGKAAGVYADTNSQPTFEDCDLSGNDFPGLVIDNAADATVLRCRLRDSGGSGVYIDRGGRGRLEDCEIAGSRYAGVYVLRAGAVWLLRCRLLDGRGSGVSLTAGTTAELEGCVVTGNRDAGLEIGNQGSAMVANCRFAGNAVGVRAFDRSGGLITDCDLTGNRLRAFQMPIYLVGGVRRNRNKT